MASFQAIRAQRRQERLRQLQQGSQALLSDPAHQQVWLFGSFARGDWDAYSDIDLLAVAPDQAAAVARPIACWGRAWEMTSLPSQPAVGSSIRQGRIPFGGVSAAMPFC